MKVTIFALPDHDHQESFDLYGSRAKAVQKLHEYLNNYFDAREVHGNYVIDGRGPAVPLEQIIREFATEEIVEFAVYDDREGTVICWLQERDVL